MSVSIKLELDITQASELLEASELAVKYQFPALVIHPGLATEGHIARGRVRGRYKIITPIDWPKGDHFGMDKVRGLSTDALEADGFEILLTPGKTAIETRNEAKTISEFIRRHISQIAEIRYIIGTQTISDENAASILTGLVGLPTPTYIRNDIHTKTQIGKANPDIHNKLSQKIIDICRAPIKICGNISDLKSLTSCKNAARFGVSLLQAKTIIKEFAQQPDLLRQAAQPHNDQN